MSVRSSRYVIVGDGAAGVTAASTLRRLDGSAHITLVSEDPNPSYFRAALTNYLMGELREEQLWATVPDFYQDNQLTRVHARVTGIDTAQRVVQLSQHAAPLPYDALLVASGARARLPEFKGSHLRGVMTLRTLSDCRSVMDLVLGKSLTQAVVVGGGALALEWALGLHVRGVKVSLLVRGKRFMEGVLDKVASDLLGARLQQSGIHVIWGDELVEAIADGNGSVRSAVTRGGLTLTCQLIAAGIGVVPNSEWLAGTGVRVDKRGLVEVNETMATSVHGVFAAGDVCTVHGRSNQLWEPAQSQAKVAASNMTGGNARYEPGVHYMATRLFDLDCGSLGVVEPHQDGNSREYVVFPQGTGRIGYRKVVVSNGRVVGALMFGQREENVRRRARMFKQLIDAAVDVRSIEPHLLDPDFDIKGWFDGMRSDGHVLSRRSLQPGGAPAPERPVAQEPSAPAPVATNAKLRTTTSMVLARPRTEPSMVAKGDRSVGVVAGESPLSAAAAAALGTQVLSGFNTRPLPQESSPAVRAAANAHARLRGQGIERALSGKLVKIGRSVDNDLCLNDVYVSSNHASVEWSKDAWYLRDQGSRSGTWVNDQVIGMPWRLNHGDRIRVGKTDLRFDDPTARPAATVPMRPAPSSAPTLQMVSGAHVGVVYGLRRDPTSVGSQPSADIFLSDASVASKHVELHQAGQGWHVVAVADFLLNQTDVARGQRMVLRDGDVLAVGQVELRYSQQASQKTEPVPMRVEAASKGGLGVTSPAPNPALVAKPVAAVPAILAVLRMRFGPTPGSAYPIRSESTLGSAPGCDIHLSSGLVGAQQLLFRQVDNALMVQNVAAKPVVWHNQRPLAVGWAKLQVGDTLQFGQVIQLVLESPERQGQ